MSASPAAVIFGCAGPELTAAERDLFRARDPLGFILFQRNCREPGETRRLVADLRASVGRADAPVLIDQEGGRVARLKPPHWRAAPPAARIAAIAAGRPDGLTAAAEAARLNARLIGAELAALGITVDCAPVLDLPQPGAHDVIGDRAYGRDPAVVAALGRAVCDGLLDAGVLPVVKHIPGHGRAGVDSHHECPVVGTARAELERTDFAPFKALADMPWAMTAHVTFTALDPTRPATVSPGIVAGIMRGHIGFDGLLVSDDLSMAALGGTLASRAQAALAAGCDVVLHCNGTFEEMAEIAGAVRPIDRAGLARVARGEALRRERQAAFDVDEAAARFDRLLASA